MRFVVTGEWSRNRLLQVIVLLYAVYVGLLWLTNALLYFDRMGLTTASVVAHYLGDESTYQAARSYQGLLEVSHFHLFAFGMLLMVMTHLMLFIPVRPHVKAWLIAVPFFAGLLDEGAGWLVRYGGAGFAPVKIAGFLLLQASLAVLIGVSVWSVFAGAQTENFGSDPLFDDEEELDEV